MANCTLLNITGDVTISWDDSNSDEIKSWIQSKIDEGCNFFILEKKLGIFKNEKKIDDVKSLPLAGKVFSKDKIDLPNFKLGDDGANNLFSKNLITIERKPINNSNKIIKITNNINEIILNDTICTKRMVGG